MKLSLKTKAILLIAVVALLIGTAGVFVYQRGIREIVTKDYEERSVEIARAVANVVDAERVRSLRETVRAVYDATEEKVLSDAWGSPEFEAYLASFAGIDESEDFLVLREQLRAVQDVIDVNCLCIVWLDAELEHIVYLVDGAYEDVCPPGVTDPIYEENSPALKDPEVGFLPLVTHTEEYGYLLACAMPIHAADGELVGYATVDMSMNEIVAHQNRLVWMTALVFFAVTVAVSLLAIFIVDRTIVRPVRKLSEAAEAFVENEQAFSELEVHTGDEIETLAKSMAHMGRDINSYVTDLLNTQNALATAKEQAELLDRAANLDALTKLRNRRAYDLAVSALERRGGSYALVMIDLNGLKEINDKYGHDKGNVALVDLAGIICKVFKRSPVFRIGGDEFVVILERDDYDAREALIGRFHDEIRRSCENNEQPKWKQISAACGCAVYDPQQDRSAESVFKRADAEMYEEKKRMKGLE